MNEIDLYVDLLDDKSSSEILKGLKETVPGFSRNPSLQQKKNYLRNVFKGQANNRNNRKSNIFYSHLISYKNPKNDEMFGELSAKDISILFSTSDNIPEYVKLGISLVYHPELINEELENLIENHKNKKPLFYYQHHFEDDEMAEKYLRKNASFITEEKVENLLNILKDYFEEKEIKEINDLKIDFESLDLYQFMNNKEILLSKFPRETVYYAYASVQKKMSEDIRLGMVLDVFNTLLEKKDESLKAKQFLINEFKQEELNFENLNVVNEHLKEEIKQCKQKKSKEYEELLNSLKKSEKSNLLIIENQNKELNNNQIKYNKVLEDLKIKQKNEIKEFKKNLLETKKSLLQKEQDLALLENEFNDSSIIDEFAIVCIENKTIIQKIFPEITSVSTNDWNKKRNGLKNFKLIYFQREGIDSALIYNIQDFCAKNEIEPVFFNARNTKEIIETISYYKFKSREGN
ncbi:hypothetical protein [Paenibacillus kandeliae]|uniref:hypothetical protein n=1 Tax=Paenibacillus kandeliae TaxID=3231269 RepID=UPI00345A945D